MKTRNNVFLQNLLCIIGFIVQQIIASSLLLQETVNFDHQIMRATQSLQQDTIATGIVTNYFDQLELDFQRKIAQDLLCPRVHQKLSSLSDEDQILLHDEQNQLEKTISLKKIIQTFSFILFLFSNRFEILGSQEENVDNFPLQTRQRAVSDPLVVDRKKHPKYNNLLVEEQEDSRFTQPAQTNQALRCCGVKIHENIRALPAIYATNIAGNLVAISVSCFAPNPIVGCAAGTCVGCAGGCLEGFSINNKYFSHDTHVKHNNFFTGYVADQVTGSCGTACLFPVANAAAVGSVAGYAGGFATACMVQQCHKKYKAMEHPFVELASPVVSQKIER